MADIVNLRRARKAKARAAKAREAAENRIRHGMTRAAGEARAVENSAGKRRHEQHRLTGPVAGEREIVLDDHGASDSRTDGGADEREGTDTTSGRREAGPQPRLPERRR